MQCPGCGFDNESDNKFCNMCGMSLPVDVTEIKAPVEREPLNLDLSLDISDLGTSGSEVKSTGDGQDLGLSLDLGSTSNSSLNLGDTSGVSFDLGSQGGETLNLDSSQQLDLSGDLNFDISSKSNESSDKTVTFDLSSSSGELNLNISSAPSDFNLELGDSDKNSINLEDVKTEQKTEVFDLSSSGDIPKSDFAAQDNTFSLDIGAPSAFKSSDAEINFDLSLPNVEIEKKEESDTSNSQQTLFDLSSIENVGTKQPVGKVSPTPAETSKKTVISTTDNKVKREVQPVNKVSEPTPTATVTELDEDVSSLIVQPPPNKLEKTSVPATKSFESNVKKTQPQDVVSNTLSAEEDASILDQFIIKKPESVPEKTFQEKKVSQAKVEVKTPPPTKQIETKKTSVDAEVDEDLAGIILGIEGKIAAPKEETVHIIDAIETSELPTENKEEEEPQLEGLGDQLLQHGLVDGVQEIDVPKIDELDVATAEEVEEPQYKLEDKLTPQEKFEKLKEQFTKSTDPDERYSLVLSIRELGIPETIPFFITLLNDELKDIKEIAAEYLGEVKAKEAVQPLIHTLSSGAASLKFIAARSLGEIGEEIAVVPLIKLLSEDNDDLRYVAIEALGKIRSGTALKAIAAFLKSRNHDLRYIACEAIGNIKDSQTVSVLLPMLKDPDFEVRLKAIEALGKTGSTEACDHLLVMLGEDNERVRLATILALGQIKNPHAVDAMIDVYQTSGPEVKEKIIWALGEIGSDRAVDPLLNLSQSFNGKQMLLALEAFAKIKSPKACKYILSILDRADVNLRLKAIEALGEIGDKQTAGNLVAFLESSDPKIKIASAKALGKIGNPIAIDPLVAKLTDSERDVRLQVIEALGQIKGAKAIGPLINSLREQDEQIIAKTEWALCELQEMAVEPLTAALFSEPPEVQVSLVRVLGRIGSIRAIFPLLKVLESADSKLKSVIGDSLMAIDRHLTEENPLSVILKEGYAWAQFSIAQALSQIGDERAFSLLIKIAKETLTEKDMKKLASIPDKRILECSGQILSLIRLNVAKLFAVVGNDKAIPKIMEYFAEADQVQRQWCVEALGGIQTESALDALIDILKKPELQVPLDLLCKHLINNKSRKLVDKLVLSASHPNEAVRIAVATVLGETRDPRAIRSLSQLVKDSSDKVRSVAIEAIGKIGTAAAVQPAIEALKDSVESVRAKAAEVLGELRDTAAVEFLEKSAKDSSELVRRLSLKALANMADTRVPDILIAALSDKAESVRGVAVEVLGARRERIAVPHLIKSLEDSAEKVREKAAVALGNIGDTMAVFPLLERLDDPSPLVPLACAEAIVSFKTRAYPVLIEALKNSEERIRRHACDLLIRIGEDTLIQKLLKLVNDRNNYLRENIARIFGKIGNEKAAEALIQLLQDRNSAVRRTAAESLGQLKDIRAIVGLKKAERDQSKEVRQAATLALQEIFKAHRLN